MPRWETHLEIAERLNKKFNFVDENREAFLLGNILPDINSSTLISDVSKKISKNATHFYLDETPSYQKFYQKYNQQIAERDPIFLGYLIHLYTDYSWNEDYRERSGRTDLFTLEYETPKWNDHWTYNDQFRRNNQKVKYSKHLVKKANEIEEVSITESDILKAINFINRGDLNDKPYQFYQPEQLDDLLRKTVIKISDRINNKLN